MYRARRRPVWQAAKGLSFDNLNDGFNGMSVAMGIMAVEWALFLVLAWYFDQVLYTGDDGTARSASVAASAALTCATGTVSGGVRGEASGKSVACTGLTCSATIDMQGWE